MKKVLMTLSMVFCTILLQAQFTKASLQASGLTCAMCSNAINKALQAIPFVELVQADIKNSAFNVTFKSNAAVEIDGLKNAVENAGFSVARLTLTGTFNGQKITADEHIRLSNMAFHFLNVSDQILQGERTITVVDKDFLTVKQFKKISAGSKMSCVQTGRAAVCCLQQGFANSQRIYHVTI